MKDITNGMVQRPKDFPSTAVVHLLGPDCRLLSMIYDQNKRYGRIDCRKFHEWFNIYKSQITYLENIPYGLFLCLLLLLLLLLFHWRIGQQKNWPNSVKHPRKIWVNRSRIIQLRHIAITTTKQSTTRPCINLLRHSVFREGYMLGKLCRTCLYRWLSTRLQYLHCVSNRDTAVLH